MTESNERLRAVADALLSVGAHRYVPVVVTAVDIHAASVRVALELHYRVATPVCCGEPGCYVGFLGAHRRRVPEALREVLALDATPRVTILATLRHEPGYRSSELHFLSSRDWTATYEPDHFVARGCG